MGSVHLFLYNTTYRFGWIDCEIKIWWVNGEDHHCWGGVIMGLTLVSYRGLTYMPYWNKGGSIIYQWQRQDRRQKWKLAHILRKCK